MGTTSSARIIQDVDPALRVLVIVYCGNGAAVEDIADSNGYRRKGVGEGEKFQFGRCTDRR